MSIMEQKLTDSGLGGDFKQKAPINPPMRSVMVNGNVDLQNPNGSTILSPQEQNTLSGEIQTDSPIKVNVQAEKPINQKPKRKPNYLLIVAIFVVISILGLGGYLGYQFYNNSRIDEYKQALTSAEQYYLKREYSDALRSINDAVAIYPNRTASYKLAVQILLDKNQLSKASEVATSADGILKREEKAELWGKIGVAYFNMKDYTNSSKALAQSNSAETETEYTSYYVKSLIMTDQIEAAGRLISKANDDALTDAWSRYTSIKADTALFDSAKVANFLLNTGYPYLTIAILDARTDIDEYWEAQYYLGRSNYEVGLYDKALPFLQNAMTLGSLDGGVATYLARTQYRLDDINESVKTYDKALTLIDNKDQKYLVASEYLRILLANGLYTKAGILLGTYSEATSLDWQLLYLEYYIASGAKDSATEKIAYFETQDISPTWQYWRDVQILTVKQSLVLKDYDKAEEINELLRQQNEYDPYTALFDAQIAFNKGEDGVRELCNRAMEYDLIGEVTQQAKDLLNTIEASGL
jgi:hypothetical protein